jgi:hypothetical protein
MSDKKELKGEARAIILGIIIGLVLCVIAVFSL